MIENGMNIDFASSEWFQKIVKAGVEPKFVFYDDFIWIDLNSGAKSHLYIRHVGPDADDFCMNTRYDGSENVTISDISNLYTLIRICMCGRDYVSSSWTDLFVKEGLLKTHTVVNTTYEW